MRGVARGRLSKSIIGEEGEAMVGKRWRSEDRMEPSDIRDRES
jgi:hypothetical protein